MARVVGLWRHPIKSHGREALRHAALTAGATFPWDRTWAVRTDNSRIDPAAPVWGPSANWAIGTRNPRLAGLWATLDETSATVTLTHRDLPPLTFRPDDPGDLPRFLDWIAPITPENRARPDAIVRLPDRGMTDTSYPSVTVMSLPSNAALAAHLGRPLEAERWRGNIWLDGLPAWEEDGWVGRSLRIGEAELTVREPVVRCLHTAANPVTGIRDADTLGALDLLRGARHFGLYCEVTRGGAVACGDNVTVLP